MRIRVGLVTLTLLFGFAPAYAATAKPDVVVGFQYLDVKTIGGLNPTGAGEMSRAVSGFVAYVNAHGGAGGRKVAAVVEASHYPLYLAATATENQRVCTSFKSKKVSLAVLGQPSRDLISCLTNAGIPVVADSQSPDEAFTASTKGRLFAPGGVGQRRVGRALAANAVRLGLAKPAAGLAVVHIAGVDLDPAAAAAAAELKRLSKARVLPVTMASVQDASSVVTQLKAAGVSAVVIVENGSSASIALMPAAQASGFAPRWLISSNSDPAGLRSIAPPTQLERTTVVSWHQYDVQEAEAEQPPALPASTSVCEKAWTAVSYQPLGRTENSVAGRLCDGVLLLKAAYDRRKVSNAADFTAAVHLLASYRSPATYGSDVTQHPDGVTVARLLDFTTGTACLCWRYLGPGTMPK